MYDGATMVGSDSGGAGTDFRQIMERSGASGEKELAEDSDKTDWWDLSERGKREKLSADAQSIYVADEIPGNVEFR